MNIKVLGSGTFFVNSQVSASSFILEIDDKKILIDCGPGTLVKLSQANISLKEIDYIFITHFHPDHTSDLFPLFMNYRLSDIFSPGNIQKYPVIYGPKGIHHFMSDYSKMTELPAYDNWNKIKVLDYPPELKTDYFNLNAFEVVHMAFNSPSKAYSLRFTAENKIVTFSGDSSDCPGLRSACKDADVFVCDTSFPKTFPVGKVHLNTTEIGNIANQCHVKKLILDHFYPQWNQEELEKEVSEIYKGDIHRAKDLETIKI